MFFEAKTSWRHSVQIFLEILTFSHLSSCQWEPSLPRTLSPVIENEIAIWRAAKHIGLSAFLNVMQVAQSQARLLRKYRENLIVLYDVVHKELSANFFYRISILDHELSR